MRRKLQGHLVEEVVRLMGLIGITIGVGVRAQEEDGVTVQAQAGLLMDSVEDGVLVLGQGVGPVLATVLAQEVVALMVVDMELEVVPVVVVVVRVQEVVAQVAPVVVGHHKLPSTRCKHLV